MPSDRRWAPARPTFAGRVAEYVASMFPPLVQVPTGVIIVLAVHAGLQGLAGTAPIRVGARVVAAAATTVLLMLLLRVQDELKDLGTDAALAAAGDPRFRDRPAVTGRITAADLARLRRVLIAVLVAVNLPLGAVPLAAFAAALIVTLLSGRWFFHPAIAGDLVLAFWTHNPIGLLYGTYTAAVFVQDFGVARLSPGAPVLLVALWLPVAAWEIARKIRAPEEETAYETWSARLGWRTAATVPPLLCVGAAAGLAYVGRASGLGPAYPAALGAAVLLVAGASLRFLRAPSPRTSRLRPYVEVFAAVGSGGLVLALALARGVGWLDAP